jgi:hypothetical protein
MSAGRIGLFGNRPTIGWRNGTCSAQQKRADINKSHLPNRRWSSDSSHDNLWLSPVIGA